MHRLLIASSELAKDSPQLSKEAAAHLRVVRPKDGEEIELFDGAGSARVFRYSSVAHQLVEGATVRTIPRPSPLTLFACVTKGTRWDWTLEKATELGVTRLVPVISERTIVRLDATERAAKRERWQRIVEEAARQSDALWLPEICEPMSFADSLDLVRTCHCLVGALTEKTRMIGSVEGDAIYVGPEGDFTPEELASLVAIATPVSFGSTVLRAETAAIFGVSVLKAKQDVSAR